MRVINNINKGTKFKDVKDFQVFITNTGQPCMKIPAVYDRGEICYEIDNFHDLNYSDEINSSYYNVILLDDNEFAVYPPDMVVVIPTDTKLIME